MVRAIIFDLGGVVVPFDFRRGYAAMAPFCAYPPEEIPKKIRSTDLVTRYETGRIGSRNFVDELCELLDLRVDFDGFCQLWSAIFLPGSLIPDDLFTRLGDRYRLIALSNTNELHFRRIRAHYPVISRFEHLILSFRVGCAKPSRRIYDLAVEKAECRAEQCLFIDDMQTFVEAAQSAGLDAMRFQGYPHLEREFGRRGIL